MIKLTEYTSGGAALIDLCRGVTEHAEALGSADLVGAEHVPEPFRDLLVHDEHMTLRLARHYGRPVELEVLRETRSDDVYRREIVLRPSGSDEVVEYGVVRIDLGFTDESVKSEITERTAPLGDILVRHDVLRRVQPHWYFRFAADSPVARAFGDGVAKDVFGRVGTIYCNEAPAIELLEVVSGSRR